MEFLRQIEYLAAETAASGSIQPVLVAAKIAFNCIPSWQESFQWP
jgi:hypothetical protein